MNFPSVGPLQRGPSISRVVTMRIASRTLIARDCTRKSSGVDISLLRPCASNSGVAGSARMLGGQRRASTTLLKHAQTSDGSGPLQEYVSRVAAGRLKDDPHQRGIVQSLQHLHDELRAYTAPPIRHPDAAALAKPADSSPPSFLSRLFSPSPRPDAKTTDAIPADLPRGLYLFGDVGSGKTMLMDMFYDTLPGSVSSKSRIHFHNFMQDVHRRLHRMKQEHGNDVDGIPFVAADIAEQGNVLCFDEFQCTDVADAMILRRLLEGLMSHGVVLVTTSNRHPADLYKNGIQRESFLPCIKLLQTRLHVLNLDSPTDYRRMARPASGVYHAPLDAHAASHAQKWFAFLGDAADAAGHAETRRVWGRAIRVPRASGTAAMFTFDELMGRPTGAADYLELMRWYDAFVVTDVPAMTHRERDLARRFITFIDAVYESRAKLVLTTAVPLAELFLSHDPERRASSPADPGAVSSSSSSSASSSSQPADSGADVDDVMRNLMDDLGLSMQALQDSSIFSGDEERFAFARALSRLSEMGSVEWVEAGLGLVERGGREDVARWKEKREVAKGELGVGTSTV